MSTFSKNFAEILKQRGLTQVQAAEALGISQSLVSAYVLGLHEPLRRTAEHIAEKLSVPVDVLLGDATTFAKYAKQSRRSVRPPKPKDPYEQAMLDLKRRWRAKPSERDQILLALRVLFPDRVDDLTGWLNKP